MKNQSMFKFVFCSLLVFALSGLFYQNSQATAVDLSAQTEAVEHTTLYGSNTNAIVSKSNTDAPGQNSGDN